MPFGSSMDAWASYYDYVEDDIEPALEPGSARPSSEIDRSEAHTKYGEIHLETLPPSNVPNSSLSPIDALYDQMFASRSTAAAESSNDRPTSLTAPAQSADQQINSPNDQAHSRRISSRVPSGYANFDHAKTSNTRVNENFSYNATPPLALVERNIARTWIGLSWGEIKLLALAGAGFLMDSYDLFIINMIYPIILRAYYPSGTHNIEWGLSGGVLKASASIGNVIGQLLFGFFGDFWGRSVMYGKELILAMIAIILMISAPDSLHGKGITIWISVFRFVMGIGIGGDYPLSACAVADRSSLKTRGLLLSLIFSNQGWGSLCAAIASMIVVAGYKSAIQDADYSKLSGAWRILFGLPLAPSIIVLYFRLTLVESARFVQARYLQDHDDLATKASAAGMVLTKNSMGDDVAVSPTSGYSTAVGERKFSMATSSGSAPLSLSDAGKPKMQSTRFRRPSIAQRQLPSANELRAAMRRAAMQSKGLAFRSIGVPRNDFWDYFQEWRHLRVLLGTSLAWFLVDITFYGINLNSSGIYALIGYTQGDAWHQIFKQALGNLIVVVAGFLPGYYLTVAFVEIIGRKKIQIVGFAVNATMFLVLALTYNRIIDHAAPFFAVFVLLQLSFNFGANSTTFIVPAEAFPTRIRATAHGFCAAMGKVGSIISSLGFNILANQKGFGHVGIFWVFFGVSILGIAVTILLVPETKGYDADAVDRRELLER